MDIKRIVCPVDLSECSRRALIHAIALARWYEAGVTVLHVFELFVPPQLLPADPGPMISPYPTRDALTADVVRFVEPLKDPRIPLDLVVEEGHVARTIAEAAKRLSADLVVTAHMGAADRGCRRHDKNSAGRRAQDFLGDGAEHETLDAAVLTLRPRAAGHRA